MFLLSGFLNLLMLAIPLFVLSVYLRVLSGSNSDPLLLLSLVTLVAIMILALLFSIRSHVLNRMGGWLGARVSASIFSAGIGNGAGSATEPLQDLERVQAFISGTALTTILDAVWMPVFLVVIWMMHPWLGMLAIASAIILYVLSSLNERSVLALYKTISKKESETMQFADAAFENSEIIQALGMQKNFLGRWYGLITKTLDDRDAVGFRVALVSGISRFIRLFLQAAVLGLGAYLILEGEITAGHMVAAFILAGWAMAPLEQLAGSCSQFCQARVAYGRIQDLLLAVPVVAMDSGIPMRAGKLEARKVSLRAGNDSQEVLKDISFTLNPGEVLVLSGKSGSGKSMLCRLLVGVLEPDLGSVLLNGEDVHAWERSSFGMHVGYLPQKVELFDGSIKQNIARHSETLSDVEVVMAAQRAGAHEMIMELPDDYDTDIGESGVELSAGQRQLVGLARAMFGNPKVLVLDEPGSNLDDEAEENFPTCLKALKNKDVTVVVVSHRPEVLACADRVLKLKEGTQESLGPPPQATIKKTSSTATSVSTTATAAGAGVSMPEFKNPYKPRTS